MDCSKEEVSTFLHSVLSCEKGGIPLSRLQEEYTVLIGSPIPYQKFGYDTLEAFIGSIPNAATIRKRSRDTVVEAVTKPSTAHMAHLVAGQKAAAKDKLLLRPGRHPAPRQAPSARFASYQSLVDGQAGSPVRPAGSAPLNPASRQPVVQRRHRGLPQLAKARRPAGGGSPLPAALQRRAPRQPGRPGWRREGPGGPVAPPVARGTCHAPRSLVPGAGGGACGAEGAEGVVQCAEQPQLQAGPPDVAGHRAAGRADLPVVPGGV
ncbi:unnamed protein product [Ixodes persulcatus]